MEDEGGGPSSPAPDTPVRMKRERQPTNFFVKESRKSVEKEEKQEPKSPGKGLGRGGDRRSPKWKKVVTGSSDDGDTTIESRKRPRKEAKSYVVPDSDEDEPESNVIPRRNDIEALVACGDACFCCRRFRTMPPRTRLPLLPPVHALPVPLADGIVLCICIAQGEVQDEKEVLQRRVTRSHAMIYSASSIPQYGTIILAAPRSST